MTMTDAVTADQTFDETWFQRKTPRHRHLGEPWSTYSVVHQQVDEAAAERSDRLLRGQVVDRVLSDW
jgi:hypothetical protein